MAVVRKLKALVCRILGSHVQPYWFVRFEYPRFQPWLWTKCAFCQCGISKVSLKDVPLMELHTRFGVASDDPCLHYWGRSRLLDN